MRGRQTDEATITEIRNLLRRGVPWRRVAEELGISTSQVHKYGKPDRRQKAEKGQNFGPDS